MRGRGWDVFDYPVSLEPAFRPVWETSAFYVPDGDDGRHHTPLSRFLAHLRGMFGAKQPPDATLTLDSVEETPAPYAPEEFPVALSVELPPDCLVGHEAMQRVLIGLIHATAPISFEVIGSAGTTRLQIVVAEADIALCTETLSAHFPEAVITPVSKWHGLALLVDDDRFSTVVDFGLANEFMLPIRSAQSFAVDPLIDICAALSGVSDGEAGVFQVLFTPVRYPWAREILASVSDNSGGAFFSDAPEMTSLARAKVATPLFGTAIRVVGTAPDPERSHYIAKRIGSSLTQFAEPGSNELIPLDDENYPLDEHLLDVLTRTTHRGGMILSLDELVSLVHVPSASVRDPNLARVRKHTKQAPAIAQGHSLVLGDNIHQGVTTEVSVGAEARTRHMYVVGGSGTGKSTLLLSSILQDINAGEGLAVIDPHGDLIESVLARIPDERVSDVIVFDPSDAEYPVPFNILQANSDTEKNLLASDLGAVFRRLSTSWGDQMTTILGNAILAFLESSEGGTLLDLRRFLTEKTFRDEFLRTVTDSEVVYFWERHFPLMTGKPQASILTRLNTFLRPKLIRHMVAQKDGSLDFAQVMDGGKIFLAKLSGGMIGEENSQLLGSLLVSKFYQVAIARQDMAADTRRDFWLYCDEFHNFVTPSMASILSGARKYRLGMVLAHQNLAQLSGAADVGSSALANAYTRICFRLGDADARKLADGFSAFDAQDLQSLGIGEAIGRIEQSANDFNLQTRELAAIDPQKGEERSNEVIAASRARYATPRADVEALLDQTRAGEAPEPIESKKKATPSPRRQESGAPAPSARSEERTPAHPSPPPLPPTEGRGGRTHIYLQSLLRKAAQDRGFHAVLEQEILDGSGRVDLALTRGKERIACEIAVTSKTEQELEHVRKALAAGFTRVVVVASEKRRVKELAAAVAGAFDSPEAQRIQVLGPEGLIASLDALQPETDAVPDESVVRGYRVKVKHGDQTESDIETHKSIARTIAASLTRMKDTKR